MAARNMFVPDHRMSVTDQKDYVLKAMAAGLERCAVKGIGNVASDIAGYEQDNNIPLKWAAVPANQTGLRVAKIKQYISNGWWPGSVETAPLDPTLELVAATALDDWLTAALAAVGTYYSCLQAIAAPQLLANKLLVVYGVSIGSSPIPVNKLRIRRGGATGNIVAEVDLQDLETKEEPSGFLGEPAVFDPQDIFAIQVRASIATNAAARVYIRNAVFGPAGTRTI